MTAQATNSSPPTHYPEKPQKNLGPAQLRQPLDPTSSCSPLCFLLLPAPQSPRNQTNRMASCNTAGSQLYRWVSTWATSATASGAQEPPPPAVTHPTVRKM
ncbi:hypothetical protein CROQUDRAFT_99564 [Cronartium quercuum f. sp. fusiforme G11]|uniref:Uncharacterized protein n=1 Tax=Cronartium quercuum f. sp. fusiforme G11 TaxID=708437 RepID=A0A9P6T6R5_9BASI|nr:hypothetical protein CROQUDRAFT_99564 [Cronartium quercuum f. sp. fusiforme G11]